MGNVLLSELCRLLEDPKEEWSFGDFTAQHESGIRIWTSRCSIPVFDTNTYPVKGNFSFWEKYKLWRSLKVARKNYLSRKIKKYYAEKN